MDHRSPSPPRSHRPLPPLSPDELAGLTPKERQAITALWQRKSKNELAASTSFAEVHRCLVLLDAPPELLTSSTRAIDDELRHAEICHWVAQQYAEEALFWPHCSRVATNAKFRGCTERESALLFVALHCALNEGIACAYLKRCHGEAQTRLVAAATRELLSDEIQHARMFWQLVASRTEEDRRLLADGLPALLTAVRAEWLNDVTLDSECPEGHGTLDGGAIERVVGEAVASLLIPGFEEAGIETLHARKWLQDLDGERRTDSP